ncbi:MAG: NAD(P)-dependent alcohol dehydrogenase [Actinomycetota bacterium]
MKAIVQARYGPPAEVLSLADIEKPTVKDEEVLVRVRAASVNALDWRVIKADPFIVRTGGLRRPKQPVPGVDAAGVVEEVGQDVTHLSPGDEVFGIGKGSFAEYTVGSHFAPKPANLTFDEAAALPVAGITALQSVRDLAHVEPGRKVLVNGAGGGVGTFTVQIAKAFGAHVTATTTTENVDLIGSLGADHVIDHTYEDFTAQDARYDAIFEVGRDLKLSDVRDALTPSGKLIYVGAGSGFGGPVGRLVFATVGGKVFRQPLVALISKESVEDLVTIKDLVEAGKLKPVIDSTHPLRETARAVSLLETGHPQGKVVISIAPD